MRVSSRSNTNMSAFLRKKGVWLGRCAVREEMFEGGTDGSSTEVDMGLGRRRLRFLSASADSAAGFDEDTGFDKIECGLGEGASGCFSCFSVAGRSLLLSPLAGAERNRKLNVSGSAFRLAEDSVVVVSASLSSKSTRRDILHLRRAISSTSPSPSVVASVPSSELNSRNKVLLLFLRWNLSALVCPTSDCQKAKSMPQRTKTSRKRMGVDGGGTLT